MQIKSDIIQFLSMYGTETSSNESIAMTELMMDDHKCIEWDNIQYYIPKNETYNGDEELIYEFLTTCYHV